MMLGFVVGHFVNENYVKKKVIECGFLDQDTDEVLCSDSQTRSTSKKSGLFCR